MYKTKDRTSLPYPFNTSTDELFYRQLREISGLLALVLVGDFNFTGIYWKYHTDVTSRSVQFLELLEDNFLPQILQLEKMPSYACYL